MNKLQKALSINAVFSAVSGTGLILFHKSIAKLFLVPSSQVFWIIGIGLLLFSLSIVVEIKKQHIKSVKKIILLDYIWVVSSALFLIFNPFTISNIGYGLIIVIALIVLFMAMNQSESLTKTKYPNQKGNKRLTFKRVIKASTSEVWKVISDVSKYHQVAPNIDDVQIISGKEKGMIRSCSHGKKSWTETCSIWQKEKTYSFIVNTSASDYPYPLSFLQGTWNITEIDSRKTEIEMIFEFTYKKQILNLIHPIMKIKMEKMSHELLDNWQGLIEN